MPMKNPPHPGRHVREELDHLHASLADAADALGIAQVELNGVIEGQGAITPEMALRLEAAIGGTAEGWIALQRAYDLAQLRQRAPEILARVRRLAPA